MTTQGCALHEPPKCDPVGGEQVISPCGTGTSARLAVMHARRQIRKGQPFDHESVIGSHFLAEIVATTRVGPKPAVVTTVAGRGWVTDIGQYGCDPEDPFPEGYTLSDTWLRAI